MFDRDSSTGDARASGREDGISLLCAGPDTDALELVRDRLERESEQFSTTAATTVTEALDHLERDAVDCVVSDHVPPDFDGLALLERVRRRDDAVPVLLFTAHGSEAIASAAIDGGVSGYVRKDAEDDQYESLSTRIQAAVDTHRESERLRKQTVGLELAETLFNNTQDALFVVDVSEEPFRLERVNPPYEELTGLSNERLRGRTLTEVFGEQKKKKIIEQYRACVESRTPLEYEEEVSVPSAGPYWDTRISPVVVEDRVETLVGATRNVTERKRERQAIERTEEFLTQVQRVADIGGWEVDERSGRLRWSAELRRIHGLPADYEPSVDAALEFVHPDDRETVEAAYERLASEGAHYDLELRFRTDDGELRWVRSRGKT